MQLHDAVHKQGEPISQLRYIDFCHPYLSSSDTLVAITIATMSLFTATYLLV